MCVCVFGAVPSVGGCACVCVCDDEEPFDFFFFERLVHHTQQRIHTRVLVKNDNRGDSLPVLCACNCGRVCVCAWAKVRVCGVRCADYGVRIAPLAAPNPQRHSTHAILTLLGAPPRVFPPSRSTECTEVQ